jgi:hypothetical protein
MRDVLDALETEYLRLKREIQITEDTFFVILADKYINRHAADLGLPIGAEGVEAKRARILARLRGLATMTLPAMENVVNAYTHGSVRITEYPGLYMFKIRFINEKGTPALMSEIMAVIEEIKPAHLSVEYIFTYRVWQEVRSEFLTWSNVRLHTWEFVRTFEITQKRLHIAVDGRVYYCSDGQGNARLEWLDGRAYAVWDEKRLLHIDEIGRVYLCPDGEGTAELRWENSRAYAARLED